MADGKVTIDTRVDSQGAVKDLGNMENKIKAPLKRIAGLVAVAFSVKAISDFAKESEKLYQEQITQETKLETVMKQRMNATDAQIQSVKDLASEQQKLGIIGDEVQLAGAQQVATFLNEKDSIDKLLPAMNNLLAQQYGYNATAESAKNIGNLLGKSMQGQTTALKRVGITFSEAEEKVLKYGNEEQRAAMLAKVINNNVGQMNQALANTPLGQQQQLANTLGDIKENFGQAYTNIKNLFLPIMNKLATTINNVSQYFITFSQALGEIFGVKLSNTASSINATASGASDLSDNIDDVADSTKKATKAAKNGIREFDELVNLQTNKDDSSKSSSSGVSSASNGVIDQANSKLTKTNTNLKKTVKRLKKILGYIDDIIKPLKNFALSEEGFPRFLDITQKLVKNIDWNSLKKNVKKFTKVLADIAKLTWINLMNFYENFLVPMATWAVNEAFPLFVDNLEELVDKFKNSKSLNNLSRLYTILAKFTKKIGTGLIKFFNKLSQIAMDYILSLDWDSFNDGLDALLDIIATVSESVGKGIVSFFSGIQPVATWLTNKVITLLKNLFEALDWFVNLEDTKDVISGMSSAIIGALTGIIAVKVTTGFINGVKNFVTAITSITSIGTSLGSAATLIGALAGALTGLMVYIKENYKSDWAKKITDELDKLKSSSEGISENISDIGTSLDSALAQTDSEVSDLKDLADAYFELSGKTSLTKDEQAKLKAIAKQLNDKLGPLGLSFDETTGYINDNKKAVTKLIQKYEEQAKQAGYTQALTGYYKNQADALVNVKQSQEKLSEALKTAKEKSDELAKSGIYAGTPKFTTEMAQYDQAVKDANKTLESAKTAYNDSTTALNELRTEMGLIDSEDLADSAKSAAGTIKTSFDGAKEGAKEFKKDTVDYLKSAATDGANAFKSKMEEKKKTLKETGEFIGKTVKSGVDKAVGAINYSTDWRYTAPSSTSTTTNGAKSNDSGQLKVKFTPLATGAVLPANKPFLSMVGDQKHGTNVEAPLDTIIQAMNVALNNRNTGNNGDIVVQIDGREVFRAVQNQANAYTNRTGNTAFA